MKFRIGLFVLMLSNGAWCFSQYRTESLPDINLKFELPVDVWNGPEIKQTKGGAHIYNYTRSVSELKKSPQATLSILVEKIKPGTPIKVYSSKGLTFFQQQPGFQLKKTFIASDGRFSLPYTVGYEAEYLDSKGTKHHLYILHTIEFNHGAQLLMDFPYEHYFLHEEEQTAIMRSLRYER